MGLGGSYRYSSGINQYTERKMRNRIFKMWFPLWRKKGFDILLTHAAAYGVDDANDWAHMGFECFVKLLDIPSEVLYTWTYSFKLWRGTYPQTAIRRDRNY